MQSGRSTAEARLEFYEEDLRPVAELIIREGGVWQNRVIENSTDLERAVAYAWNAVSCYWAVADWREGMLFVSPDDNTAGFFIAAHPVSVAEFSRFAEDRSWRVPVLVEGNDELPMIAVTAYDAVACLAALPVLHRLPTESEWRRAVRLAADAPRGGAR